MKILAICGSPRKGNTYSVLNFIKENNLEIDFKILQLNKLNFDLCKGCYACIKQGEYKCPVKDDRDMIFDEMLKADGLILATPVYSHMVSAIVKNFFDRFGYLAHRPLFFDKFAMSVATCSGYGAEEAIKYMDKMLSVFGFNLVQPLELHFRPGNTTKKINIQNQNKILAAFDKFVKRIEKGGRDKPPLGLLIPFQIFKYVSEVDRKNMPADYEYYKDKTDYYYETKIPFHKKYITKKVVKKIIAGFD